MKQDFLTGWRRFWDIGALTPSGVLGFIAAVWSFNVLTVGVIQMLGGVVLALWTP